MANGEEEVSGWFVRIVKFLAWFTMYVFMTIFGIGIAENMLNIDMSDPFWLATIVITLIPASVVMFQFYEKVVTDIAAAITIKIVSMTSPELLEILEKQKYVEKVKKQ